MIIDWSYGRARPAFTYAGDTLVGTVSASAFSLLHLKSVHHTLHAVLNKPTSLFVVKERGNFFMSVINKIKQVYR